MSRHQVLRMFHMCVTVCLVCLIPTLCHSAATSGTNVGKNSRTSKHSKDNPEQLDIVPSLSGVPGNPAEGTRKPSQGGDVPSHSALLQGGDVTRKHRSRIMSPMTGEEQMKTDIHPRPVRSPQQGTDPLPTLPESKIQNQPVDQQLGYYGEIIPTVTIDQRGTEYESPAEQKDDELEEKLDMLRLRYGYMNSVLPENMSMYPDVMNYTEPAEEAEEAEEAGGEEQEEQGEYEADEYLMSASVNISQFGDHGNEYEADEGLQPSGSELRPYKVHNMSSMVSDVYDPYYNYGYQYRPKKDNPAQVIQATPVISDVQMTGSASAGSNGTTGMQAKITDVKTITQKKNLADFGGMSVSATFGIVVGSIIGFWLVMGPLVCLLMKVRDHHKEKQKRFMLAPRHGKDKSDNGIMEAMIMTELGKLSLKSKKKYTAVRNPTKTPDRQSLTDDRELDTFHDACDTPALLP
ncbi:uncharacterized protein LOC124115794 [Haliotis rufescens]|uniref:uncharacterized protein LOC124115794 n=1 Tax=Haliotis rufescens TaxID=6454 RepID=UPI00201EE137|nr:uncharacterized protein LOC124115794 [Haliotis rufescens]XP_046332870.2 uncharacterized protein LOC124115794 [Haliotis rufescens]